MCGITINNTFNGLPPRRRVWRLNYFDFGHTDTESKQIVDVVYLIIEGARNSFEFKEDLG